MRAPVRAPRAAVGGSQKAAAPAGPPQAQQRPSIVASLLIALSILMMILPPGLSYEPAAATDAVMPTEGSATTRMLWLGLLAFGIAGSLARSRAAMRTLRQVNPFLLLFVALVASSVAWSIMPVVTVRRLVRVVTTVLDALAFVVLGWRSTRFQDLVRPVLTGVLVGSIIFVIVSPDLAIEHGDTISLLDSWHGLATQKNGLGSLASIGLILWAHAWVSKERPGWLAALGIAVSLLCLVKSRSSTSLMDGVFATVLMLMLMRTPAGLRRYMPYLIVLFSALVVTYSLAVLNLVPGTHILLSPITSITGKDLTFSGRSDIWAILREHIALRPLLGSGYGAYWVQVPDSPSMQMLQQLYFYPTEGHNGYLDVINDLGTVGVLCLLGYLIVFLRQGLRLFKLRRMQGALYLALLFQQLIENMSESRWFNSLCVEFTIVTLATFALARSLAEAEASTSIAGAETPRRLAPGPARRVGLGIPRNLR